MKKIIFVLTILFFITPGIKAESITVENYSFEEPGTTSFTQTEGPLEWGADLITGYSFSGWNVTQWTTKYVGLFEAVTEFPDVDGDQTAYCDNSAQFTSNVITTTQANTHYTLTVALGNRDVDTRQAGEYLIELLVDDETAASNFIDGQTITLGTFADLSAQFVSTVSGGELKIRLTHTEPGPEFRQGIFDNVRLDTAYAYNPSPMDGATLVPVDTDLSWTLIEGFTCNVYFGTDPNVADNDMVIIDQDAEFYDPFEGKLDFDTTYYWRVDPIDPNDGIPTVITGSTWIFTTVPPTPIITAQPQDVIAEEGGTAVFTVEAYDPQGGTLAYQWYKFVDGINDLKLSGEKSATLTITPVTFTDQGQYYCEISNVDPRPTLSDRASLLIKDIIGWWSFDSTLADPNNYDLSGNGNDVIIYGAKTAEGGTALEFDGIDDYISVPVDVFSRLGTSQVTICLWQYGTGPQYTTVFQGIDDADPDPAYASRVLNAHIPWGTEVFWDSGDDTGYDRVYKAAKESEYSGKWNHWTFTKNTSTGQMKIYLNGGLWQSGTDLTTPIGIGDIIIFNIAANPVPDEFYSGMLKDFRIYSYELTAEEIAQMYYDITGQAPCMTPLPGDADGDCLVTVADIVLLATEWLDCGLYPPSECP
jgi:hypothetical protein